MVGHLRNDIWAYQDLLDSSKGVIFNCFYKIITPGVDKTACVKKAKYGMSAFYK